MNKHIWTPCKGLSKPFVSVDTRRNAEAKSQTFFYILIQVWWNKKYKLQYFRVKTIPIPILLHMTMRFSLNDLIYLILSNNLRKFVLEYLYFDQIFINYFWLLFWTINQNDHHLSKGCKKSIFRFEIVVCMHGWWWLSGYFKLYSNDGECRLSNKLAVVGL